MRNFQAFDMDRPAKEWASELFHEAVDRLHSSERPTVRIHFGDFTLDITLVVPSSLVAQPSD